MPNPSHIIIGLSGGVDSAVAAYLLKKANHKVEAIFMKNWEDEPHDACTAEKDLHDAEAVCDVLKINLKIVNFASEYWEKVFAHFLDEYQAGRTPNPDILCNKEIKFKVFLDYAKKRGADYIATGHYAKTHPMNEGVFLQKAADLEKDQTYFLHQLNQDQLSQSLFPLGGFTKKKVRELAKEIGLPNHNKKDSTGICFIGERKFKNFLNQYLPAQPGLIMNLQNEILGEHDGLMFYTIGQRQGLKIGGKKNQAELPWYVIKKDLKKNILYIGQGNDHPALFQTIVRVNEIHWINREPNYPISLSAKTRYRQADQICSIEKKEDHFIVQFDEPQRAITPGQSVVFYDGSHCLGGGIIDDR